MISRDIQLIGISGGFYLTEHFQKIEEFAISFPIAVVSVMGKNGIPKLWNELGFMNELEVQKKQKGIYMKVRKERGKKLVIYLYLNYPKIDKTYQKLVLICYLLSDVFAYTSICGLDKHEGNQFRRKFSLCLPYIPESRIKPNFIWFIQDVIWNTEDENQIGKLLIDFSMKKLFDKKEAVTLFSYDNFQRPFTSPSPAKSSFIQIESRPMERFHRNIDFRGFGILVQYIINDLNGSVNPCINRSFLDYLKFIREYIIEQVVKIYKERIKKDLSLHLPTSEKEIIGIHLKHLRTISSHLLNTMAILPQTDRKKLYKRISAFIEKNDLASILKKNKDISSIHCNQTLAQLYFENVKPLDDYSTIPQFQEDIQQFKLKFLKSNNLGPERFNVLSSFLNDERKVVTRLTILLKSKKREEYKKKIRTFQNKFYTPKPKTGRLKRTRGRFTVANSRFLGRRRISIYTPTMTSTGIPKLLVSKIKILGVSDHRPENLKLNIKFFRKRELFISHLKYQIEGQGKVINALTMIGGMYFISCRRKIKEDLNYSLNIIKNERMDLPSFYSNNNNSLSLHHHHQHYSSRTNMSIIYKIEISSDISRRVREVYRMYLFKKKNGEMINNRIIGIYKNYNKESEWFIVWKKNINPSLNNDNKKERKTYNFYMYILEEKTYDFKEEVQKCLENKKDWVTKIFHCDDFWFALVKKKFGDEIFLNDFMSNSSSTNNSNNNKNKFRTIEKDGLLLLLKKENNLLLNGINIPPFQEKKEKKEKKRNDIFPIINKNNSTIINPRIRRQQEFQICELLFGNWKKVKTGMIGLWKKGFSVVDGTSNYNGTWFILMQYKRKNLNSKLNSSKRKSKKLKRFKKIDDDGGYHSDSSEESEDSCDEEMREEEDNDELYGEEDTEFLKFLNEDIKNRNKYKKKKKKKEKKNKVRFNNNDYEEEEEEEDIDSENEVENGNKKEWYQEIHTISQLQDFLFETRLLRMYISNLLVGIKN